MKGPQVKSQPPGVRRATRIPNLFANAGNGKPHPLFSPLFSCHVKSFFKLHVLLYLRVYFMAWHWFFCECTLYAHLLPIFPLLSSVWMPLNHEYNIFSTFITFRIIKLVVFTTYSLILSCVRPIKIISQVSTCNSKWYYFCTCISQTLFN